MKQDPKPLEREFAHFLENRASILERYAHRVVVIVGGEVVGDYDNESQAITETVKTRSIGTFLVQRVSPGEEAHTARFRSRVAIGAP